MFEDNDVYKTISPDNMIHKQNMFYSKLQKINDSFDDTVSKSIAAQIYEQYIIWQRRVKYYERIRKYDKEGTKKLRDLLNDQKHKFNIYADDFLVDESKNKKEEVTDVENKMRETADPIDGYTP